MTDPNLRQMTPPRRRSDDEDSQAQNLRAGLSGVYVHSTVLATHHRRGCPLQESDNAGRIWNDDATLKFTGKCSTRNSRNFTFSRSTRVMKGSLEPPEDDRYDPVARRSPAEPHRATQLKRLPAGFRALHQRLLVQRICMDVNGLVNGRQI